MNRVIIFPTDTVYGIGCKIKDVEAIKKIYRIKQRSYDKPLACLCADLKQIEAIAYVDKKAKKLINEFLPGPLTIILKAKKSIYDKIGYKTIGVRIPNCKETLEILKSNGPMLTTSVNDSGKTPMNEYEDIKEKYSKIVKKIYKPSNSSSNLASTVVSIVDKPILLREGSISLEQIKLIINE